MIRLLQGSVFDVLAGGSIAPGSVDLCVTSPPYWMLRSYLPKGHVLKPQELGSEPTPAEFVDNLVRVFRLVRDTMADHGTCWVNIGDTYASGEVGRHDTLQQDGLSAGTNGVRTKPGISAKRETVRLNTGVPAGNLCLIPQRLAIALQSDGWLVRSVVVWHKPAPMPASLSGWAWRRCQVKTAGGINAPSSMAPDSRTGLKTRCDAANNPTEWSDCPGCLKCEKHGGYVLRKGSWRPTSSWEPILMLAKTADYFCDGEGVKTPNSIATTSRYLKPIIAFDCPDRNDAGRNMIPDDPSGANLRDVWTIAAEPLKEKHYAAFPSELVLRCIRAGTSLKGYCPTCGKPWCRVIESKEIAYRPNSASIRGHSPADRAENRGPGKADTRGAMGCETATLDWRPSCSCPPAPPRPGLVLDPFAGSGRTLLTARRLGLDAVGVELNESYVQMATRLIEDDSPLFNQVETVSTQEGLTPGTEGPLSEFALRAEAEKS